MLHIFLQDFFLNRVVKLVISGSISNEEPGFDHRGLDGQILLSKLYTVFNSARAMADFHAEPPNY